MVRLVLDEGDVLPCGRVLGTEIDQINDTAIFICGNEIIKFSTLLDNDTRFNHEVRVHKILNDGENPIGIPKLIHVGKFYGADYMVLENCGREIDPEIIWEQPFRAKIAKIINYMHSCGIVHADIKPENITQKANDDIYIIDFDSALIIGENAPFKNVGTYPYYPPEIAGNIKGKPVVSSAKNDELGKEIDYFMFGMTLLESEKEKPFARQFIDKKEKYLHKRYKKMEMKKFILRHIAPANRGYLQQLLAELPQDRTLPKG